MISWMVFRVPGPTTRQWRGCFSFTNACLDILSPTDSLLNLAGTIPARTGKILVGGWLNVSYLDEITLLNGFVTSQGIKLTKAMLPGLLCYLFCINILAKRYGPKRKLNSYKHLLAEVKSKLKPASARACSPVTTHTVMVEKSITR